MSEKGKDITGQIISAIKGADESVLKRWIVPMVTDKILLNGEYTFCFTEKYQREMTEEEAKEKGYLNVEVPFSGLYQSMWASAIEGDDDMYREFMDYLTVDKYEKDASDNRKELWGILEKTDVIREQVKVDRDNLGDWISGKKSFSIWVPMVMERIFEANLYGIRQLLDYTYLSDAFAALDWKLDTCWSPKDRNYATDHLYYWVRGDIWKQVCIPEVFNSKWYKTYAKVMTTPEDGYIPWEKYEDYFDIENPCCNKAVLRFWVAMGAYGKYHGGVVKPEEFNNVKASDCFNDTIGIVDQQDSIDASAADIWNKDYKIEDAN